MAAGAALTSGFPGSLWGVAVLACIAYLAERQAVRIGPSVEITVSILPMLFAAVVYGPLAAMAVGAFGLLADFGRPHTRWVVWTAIRSITGGSAGIAALLLLSDTSSFGTLAAACLVAVLTEAVVDSSLGAITVAIRGTSTVGGHLRSLRPMLVASLPLYVPLITLLAFAHREVSGWTVALFFAPALAAHSFYRLYHEQREAASQLGAANAQLARANLSFATALVATLEARDRYTAGHSAAVAVYARDIAERMGISDHDMRLAHLAGLVHDIGKVGLPVGLLEKSGPMTLVERRQMEQHAVIGARILANVSDYAEIARIVRHHHERLDGMGYPDGLAGEEIPIISRIIAVADAYNAMTSDRPYREALPSRSARVRLANSVGSQFDASIVAAFEAILATASEDYRSGRRDDFMLGASETKRLKIAGA